ncbi:MAE_28990/MAE_18760 family HEPN-like nuclease [Limimaricola hongkongensis]|uniref:MAE_28990/MAE_18760 family HEPN-like nuclease n=1 Tax=Limimaricola hongkongensis TaxID=278132 RepID=UPI0013A5B774|nr:MAE_28990/MAE_18760 family HEPN-like nuclease [Limimaricola hongkongensis]
MQEEINWRVIECSQYIRSLDLVDASKKAPLLRAGVPFFYAHWEGYFVFAANSYLDYISNLKMPLSSLRDNFWALQMMKGNDHRSINSETQLYKFLERMRQEPDSSFRAGRFEKIKGRSNLRYEVVEYSCMVMGVDGSSYRPYSSFIDEDLCDVRNSIAHGSALKVKEEDVISVRDKVLELMRVSLNEFENAAIEGRFKKLSPVT